ncbi:MAG: LytTR family transcriptional regulator DNA-binding domain-containing protein [Roseburia sp.]|nr:LytTR family transcriptional regulator DNA-binding domain-containing protein [Roseburia sp.]
MEIHYYQERQREESRVDVYFRQQDEEIQNLMAFLEKEQVVIGMREGETRRIFPNEIYYLEIVDRRCFAYLQEEVWQLELSLKSFLEKYEVNGFVQIGKSVIANINKIERIVPDINMRMHLMLKNGEKLVVNRSYKKQFMESLKGAKK